jgi:hypothetical protein
MIWLQWAPLLPLITYCRTTLNLMSRQHISLKCRVRYEGRVRVLDRRAPEDAIDKIPNPIWRLVNRALRAAKIGKPKKGPKPSGTKAKSK